MAIDVRAEIQIHTARATVWQVFANTAAWPLWHTQVEHTEWATSEAWRENALLLLRIKPVVVPIVIQARMQSVVPASLVVWESRVPGLTAVHVFEFTDSLGGCRVREKETFHGPLSLGLLFLRGYQTSTYTQSLRNLKLFVESGP